MLVEFPKTCNKRSSAGMVATAVMTIAAIVVVNMPTTCSSNVQSNVSLWLTIRAQDHMVELSWENVVSYWNDQVIITTEEANRFEMSILEEQAIWLPEKSIVCGIFELDNENFSISTKLPYNHTDSPNMGNDIGCYRYWASLLDNNGKILATACISTYSHWMRDLRLIIGGLRIRDLFIPGTRSSGAYAYDSDIHSFLKTATKYEWTQDDDIRGQLMHGVRYLDIAVGYYADTREKFFINRGFSRIRPLLDVIKQVKSFVIESQEIVIFDIHDFPVGFSNQTAYIMLVRFLQQKLGHLLVKPPLSWNNTLNDMWFLHQHVIITCGNHSLVRNFPNVIFGTIEQLWGDGREWSYLRRHLLKTKSYDPMRRNYQPVAVMAVLTPHERELEVTNFRRLRAMIDAANRDISVLFRKELSHVANIVAADFIRSSTLIQSAIEYNKLRFDLNCINCKRCVRIPPDVIVPIDDEAELCLVELTGGKLSGLTKKQSSSVW